MLAVNTQLLLNLKTYNNGTETLLASFRNFQALLASWIRIKPLELPFFVKLFWMRLEPS
jgi:hypothetical protein